MGYGFARAYAELLNDKEGTQTSQPDFLRKKTDRPEVDKTG